jgi:2,4-dienoyl-CoA reductase-like NADH-dependent reductase (Old Yellow Enzyme family)
MDEHDIAQVRDAFVMAAKRSVRLGFDAIELHMAHGYLAHSFLSPISNQRTDRYGGDYEGRARFALETAEAVRAAVPRGIALGARITGSDWTEGGLTADDAVRFARDLKARGLDFVDISSGGITSETRNPVTPGYNVPLAAQVKRGAGIATRTVGLITTAEQAEAILAEGQADMVALARAFLDNPHWAWAAARRFDADVDRPSQYLRVGPKLWPGPTPTPASLR